MYGEIRPFQAFKLEGAYYGRQIVANRKPCLTSRLVGTSNEADVIVESSTTKALIDTGSCVSTISEAYYRKELSDLELQPINQILNIECADGKNLPYLGFIEASLEVVGIPMNHKQHCLFLVIPESSYSKDVPILLGTNVLSSIMNACRTNLGERYLQNSGLFTPWYLAFRAMTIRERSLQKQKCLAIVRSAETGTVLIRPNSSLTIKGYTTHELDYHPTCAIVESTKDSVIPDDIDVTPTLVNYRFRGNGVIDIHISNITMRTVTVSPKAILGALHPVVVEELQTSNNDIEHDDHMDRLNIENERLSEEQWDRARNLLKSYEDLFSKGDTDIGHYKNITHKIHLIDETPFKQRYRRIPPSMIDEVRSHLEQLLAAGIIRKSHSPFASNAVLVRKKDNSLRLCIDYRMLNQKTKRDQYALPRIEDILDRINGAKYFSVLDMKSGYHQVEIEESHKERTAFTLGSLGFYEFNRLPFGLSNSPATYQRLMEACLGDLNMKICFVYLDDLIIFSNTYEEHLERLDTIFSRLRQCNLKLATKKCAFFKDKVKYVGFIVSENGISTDPDKVEKVVNWPTPTCPDEVRQFVAFSGFYRRFIKNFSKVVKPLSEVMPAQNQRKRRKKFVSSDWKWGSEQQEAFDELKSLMTSAPILAYANYSSPFELHIDASAKGLGAVLCQQQNGQMRVISYGSRSLNRSERNYPTMKLEFLALKWSITEKFHDYLYGNKFVVVTDNNPLTYVLTSAKLDATGQRWVSSLAVYDFELMYKSGKSNIDADTMSRHPFNEIVDSQQEVATTHTVKAICSSIQGQGLIDTIAVSNIDIIEATETEGYPMAQLDVREIRQQQRLDPVVGFWLRLVKDKVMPIRTKIPHTKEHSIFYRIFKSLTIIRGVLYRVIVEKGKTKQQLVLPSVYIEQVLEGLHNNMGHPGRDRTSSLIRDRFFWPGMSMDVENWIKQCGRCVRRKSPTNTRAPLVSITSSYPLELVCMDYLSLEPCKGGIGNVLVITDHFTRYAIAIPTRNQTAKTTADAFFNNFIVHYGFPAKIHTDQGANFESEMIRDLCELAGITKSRTSPYHAMGNGMTERFNRTLIGMLGTLDLDRKQDWKAHIAPLVHAYNSIRHESTGYSPYELMFGRPPRLAIDVMFDITESTEGSTHSEYIENLRERLKKSYDIVQNAADKSRTKQKKYFDRKARASKVDIGDEVLVKILAHDGKHKLSDKFEKDIYTVVGKPCGDIPVFIVRSPDNKERTLHRNHLLPVGTDFEKTEQMSAEDKEQTEIEKEKKQQRPVPTPRKRQPQSRKQEVLVTGDKRQDSTVTCDTAEQTSDEEEYLAVTFGHTNNDDTELERVETVGEEEIDPGDRLAEDDRNAIRDAQPEGSPERAPRRSQRARRPPRWHDTYNMSQISKSPGSSDRSDAIKALVHTGALSGMSLDIVDKVIDAVVE